MTCLCCRQKRRLPL